MPFNRKEVKLAEDPIVHGSYNVPKRSSNDIALLKVCSSWTRCYLLNSPSSLVTHIEALLSTGIRLQTHKDSSCRYTRPGLQASLYCLQPA